MKKFIFITAILTALGMSALLVGCDKEGPAEKVGEKIDNAVEDTKENLQQTKETIQDKLNPNGPAENVGEEIDEAAEKAKEKALQAKKKVEEAVKQ
jgi:hypothetical protein